jgi:hypothetical protein
MKKMLIGFAAVLIMLSITGAAIAASTFYPTDDSYVKQQNPTQSNWGEDYSFMVSSQHTSKNQRALLKFDLSPIPDNCTITGATLELYMISNPGPGNDRTDIIYFISDDTWTETTVTWNSQPGEGSALDSVSTSTVGLDKVMRFGTNGPNSSSLLAEQVSTEYSKNKILSLLIKDSVEDDPVNGNHQIEFASSENPTQRIPDLMVEYTCGDPNHYGCSHGFWKQHDGIWPTGYLPSAPITNFFSDVPSDLELDSLSDALGYSGGPGAVGAAKILLRNAVASLLNSESGINYSLLTCDLITLVNNALASENRDTMLDLEELLDAYNNLGAPGLCN